MIYDSNGNKVTSRYRLSIFDWLVIVAILEIALWASCSAAHASGGLQCPPHPGVFGSAILSPDGRTLVCLVDAAVPGKYELYGVNGIAPPWRISHNMADDRDVVAFAVASDRVAFTSDYQRGMQWYELYSAPLSGSLLPVKLSGVTAFDNDVDDLAFSGDERRVIYRKGRNATGVWELYSAPSSGLGGPPNRLISQPGIAAVQRGFIVSGNVVRFAQDLGGSGNPVWYRVTVMGGAEIFLDGFEQGNLGGWG